MSELRIKGKGLNNKFCNLFQSCIMLSRSLGKIDLMRTDYMLSVADAIVGRGVIYPDWRISCTIYLAVFLPFAWGCNTIIIYTRKTQFALTTD